MIVESHGKTDTEKSEGVRKEERRDGGKRKRKQLWLHIKVQIIQKKGEKVRDCKVKEKEKYSSHTVISKDTETLES